MKKSLLLFSCLVLFSLSKAQTGTTVAGGNGAGTAADQLSSPNGVFVDAVGYIYVADFNNNRIQKFPPNSTSATNGVTVAGGNGQGSAADQLSSPSGVWLDASGNIYVADTYNDRIQKFPANSTSSSNGVTIAGGNGNGGAANQLNHPLGLCLDANGNIYVADGNERVQMFPPGSTSATSGVTVAGNGYGSAADQLSAAAGVFVDAAGYLYVADSYNTRIQKFPPASTSGTSAVTVARGTGSGRLTLPVAVFVDSLGKIYVVDVIGQHVLAFPSNSDSLTNGVIVAGGIDTGSTAALLHSPTALFVAHDGSIYISDQNNNRIQKWTQATGISDISSDHNISLYPNPNNGSFILQSSGNVGKQCAIYDMVGRKLAEQLITSDKQPVELKDLSIGTYTLKVHESTSKTILFAVTR